MLYLQSPVVLGPGGVTFYPDHNNDAAGEPRTWYYLPLAPRYSRDASGDPAVRLTKYMSDADAFAVLDFDVNLGLDEAQRPAYARALKETMKLQGDPQIAPLQAVEGTVSVMLLGKQSNQSGASALVKGISVPAAPSLYNDNRAIFSIVLSPAGSDLVESTLQTRTEEEMTAVGVVYDLSFDALRPAYAVKAHASWKQVHTYLKEQFAQDGVFFGADISKTVDDMKNSKVIDIQVDNLLGKTDQETAVEAMLGQVKSLIFDSFFKPAIPRAEPGRRTFWDGLQDAVKAGARAYRTFGLSELAHFQWTREDRTELLTQTLDIDLRERSVVRIKLYPQAHLTQLLRGVTTSLVREVTADTSDFFKKRTLEVDTNLPLAADGISSIVVDLSYGGRQQSARFAATTPDALPDAQSVSWIGKLDANRRMVRGVTASYTVNFKPRAEGNAAWPASLTSPPHEVTGDYWTVNPRTLYSVYPVRFLVSDKFPWNDYKQLTVRASYRDARNNVSLTAPLVLRSTSRVAADDPSVGVLWPILQRDPAARSFSYRLSYDLAGETIDLGPEVTTDAALVLIEPAIKEIWVMPPDPWPSWLDAATVRIAYDDPVTGKTVRLKDIFIASAEPEATSVRLLLSNAANQVFRYEVIFEGAGKTVKIQSSRSENSTLRLSPSMKGHDIVAVRPDPAVFADGAVTKVVAALTPPDPAPGTTPTQVTFLSASDVARYEYDFASAPGYTCQPTYSLANGDRYKGKAIKVTDVERFRIPPPPPQ